MVFYFREEVLLEKEYFFLVFIVYEIFGSEIEEKNVRYCK